jgi:octanoyl-[GcvH]:protein N-octanoyltransferase
VTSEPAAAGGLADERRVWIGRPAAKLRPMPSVEVEWLEGPAGAEPALELALTQALLAAVADGRRGPVLRCYRPPPTVAFGCRDSFLAGFSRAAVAAERRGFAPVIRGAGGRAAAYDDGCLVLDEIMPSRHSMSGIRERFASEAAGQAQALRSLGVDARVGEVPGEYCAGEFSVNARGRTKLIGSAQRTVRGAWLFSTVVVVRPAGGLRAVLEDVYAELGLQWEPATTGSVADEVPDVSIEDVQRALLGLYAPRYRLISGSFGVPELAAARELLGRHRVNV